MASEEKESSVLFTLKELKDIAASPADGAGEHSKPKARKTRTDGYSFIDDADSLLADIRDSVDDAASAEAKRIEDERTQAAESLEEARKAEESERQTNIQNRLAAEEARRRVAADEREARAHALDIAERRARGEIIEEPEREAPPTQVEPPKAAEPPKKRLVFYLLVLGVPLLALGGIAGMVLMDDTSQFSSKRGTGEPLRVGIRSTGAGAVGAETDSSADAGYVDAAPKKDAAAKKGKKGKEGKEGKKRRRRKKVDPQKKPDKGKGLNFNFKSGGDIDL